MHKNTPLQEPTPSQCLNDYRRRDQRYRHHASKAASEHALPVAAMDVQYARDEIAEALDAFDDLQKRGSSQSQPVETFWTKKALVDMRKTYGKNFKAAEKVCRRLIHVGMEIELATLQQKDAEARLDALTEEEKTLSQKLQELDTRH